MSYNLLWIFLLILQTFTASLPVPNQYDLGVIGIGPMNSPKIPSHEDSSDEKVISVSITSSIAVGRGRSKPTHGASGASTNHNLKNTGIQSTTLMPINEEIALSGATEVPPNLVGANIEYLKQLNAKKETREHNSDTVHPFHLMVKSQFDIDDGSSQKSATKIDEYEDEVQNIPLARKVPSTANANNFYDHKGMQRYPYPNTNTSPDSYVQIHNINMTNDTLYEPLMKIELKTNIKKNIANNTNSPIPDLQFNQKDSRDTDQLVIIDTFAPNRHNYQSDSVAESSIKSVEFAKYNERNDNIPATMLPVGALNNIQGLTSRPLNEGRNNPRLTTVSFNIVHDTSKTNNDNEPRNSYISSSQIVSDQKQFYEPPKIYSQPAQIYSEPAKFYSEPSKLYSEPAKIYSEPAKVYSEPAKIYSEPSKFYSELASLHLNQNVPSSVAPNYSPWQRQPQRPFGSTSINTTPISIVTNMFQQDTTIEHQPEKNYEVDEKISVLTDGRSHGVQQETSTEKCKQDNCKVGYVVEGRQFKKYRVEERTPDGFIVGEYGVVRNEDGALRGVRYTADGDASPRLIHDALMKFLQLK